MRTSFAVIILVSLVGCAQKLETIGHVKQYNHTWQCVSVQTHHNQGKDIKSVLSYNYNSIEFRSQKTKDGSFDLTYSMTFPGSKNATSALYSGLMRLEPIIQGKQWVSDEWYRVYMKTVDGHKTEVMGQFTKTRSLRQVDGENYQELEVQRTINGEEIKGVQELWSRTRKEIGQRKVEEVRRLLNPEQIEAGLKSWSVTCTDEWESP